MSNFKKIKVTYPNGHTEEMTEDVYLVNFPGWGVPVKLGHEKEYPVTNGWEGIEDPSFTVERIA